MWITDVIIDLFKMVIYIAVGFMFGLAVGLIIGIIGFVDFFVDSPDWLILLICVLFSLGISLFIILFKSNKIEGVKNVE